MCGITGAIGYIDPSIQDAVKRTNKAMSHRGPDGDGYWSNVAPESTSNTGVVLAHRRLAIIDLTEAGYQPMVDSESGSVITYNGEFYNHQEIRTKLESDKITCTSDSDTEVLLKALVHHGMDALSTVNGMFAFAFWNPNTDCLEIARDRMGIKPLYYTTIKHTSGKVTTLFSSELTALLNSNLIPRQTDTTALDTYLWNGYVSGQQSLIKGVFLLDAGHRLHIDKHGHIKSSTNYWKLPEHSETTNLDELNSAFKASVKRRLISDVPLGVFLSGGIDSSAVAVAAQEVSTSAIHTFNIGFPESEFDESPYALQVAEKLETNHTSINLTEDEFKSNLANAMKSIDQPTFDAINTYFVSKSVKDAGITVALSGAGGDELFGGYSSFTDVPKVLKANKILGHLPKSIISVTANSISRIKYGKTGRIKPQVRWGKIQDSVSAKNDLVKAFQVSYSLFTKDTLALLRSDYNDSFYGLTSSNYNSYTEMIQTEPTLPAISKLELSTFISQRLLRDTDSASMAVSLEARVPFLDHEYIECALSLDEQSRFYPLGKKNAIRKSALASLPEEFFDRPKSGFVLPIGNWIKNTLSDQINEVFNDTDHIKNCGLNPKVINDLWLTYQSNSPGVYWSRIWALYVYLDWCQRHKVTL